MLSLLILLLIVAPWLTSVAMAVAKSRSFWSVFIVLFGAIGGAILICLVGIYCLYEFHRSWMESQAAGFIFLPVILPFLAYIGSVAGASLVAILYGYRGNHLPSPLFQIIAITLTVILGGSIPSLAIAIPSFSSTTQVNNFIIPIAAICIGVFSSWMGSKFAYLLVTSLFR